MATSSAGWIVCPFRLTDCFQRGTGRGTGANSDRFLASISSSTEMGRRWGSARSRRPHHSKYPQVRFDAGSSAGTPGRTIRICRPTLVIWAGHGMTVYPSARCLLTRKSLSPTAARHRDRRICITDALWCFDHKIGKADRSK